MRITIARDLEPSTRIARESILRGYAATFFLFLLIAPENFFVFRSCLEELPVFLLIVFSFSSQLLFSANALNQLPKVTRCSLAHSRHPRCQSRFFYVQYFTGSRQFIYKIQFRCAFAGFCTWKEKKNEGTFHKCLSLVIKSCSNDESKYSVLG